MNVFDEIRRITAYALTVARDVQLDEESLDRLGKRVNATMVRERAAAIETSDNAKVDVHFDSIRDNVNYRAMFGLIQLGHGFRYELHRTTGVGASKTIISGMNSLAREKGGLSAASLAALTATDVKQHFGIEVHHVTKELALATLAEQILDGLAGTGKILVAQGHAGMYDFVVAELQTARTNGSPPAAHLVLALKETFPSMNDVGTLHDGTEVRLCKKAILSAHEIKRAVGPIDGRFVLDDMHCATRIIDNMVPAMLVKLGAMKLSEDLSATIQGGKLLPRGPQETELRAVGVALLERLSVLTGVGPSTLSYYFWLIGKDGDNRDWKRHHTQDTVFY